MHRYKFTMNCGVNLIFESKHHIDEMSPVIFPDTAFLDFRDAEFVIKLTEVKDVEIDGVKYQLKEYTA